MRLIKLTNPELIEEFFAGEESVEVLESCKVVTATENVVSEIGALIILSNGVVSIKLNDEAPVKKESKKKK